MHLSSLDRLLWALALILHCVLLAVLFGRHRAARFPVFTSLIAFDVLRSAVLFFVLRRGSVTHYFYAYWTAALVDVALQFAIAWELATHVFRPLGFWAPDVRRGFAALLGVGLVIDAGLTWLANPATSTLRSALVVRGDFFASVLLSEIFVAMTALSVTLGLPWRTHVSRIAQGFGTFALFGILSDAALTWFGTSGNGAGATMVSHLKIEFYLLCLCYWIITLARGEPQPRKLPAQLHHDLLALRARAALLLRDLRTTGSAS